jgi:putative oxidoreductase
MTNSIGILDRTAAANSNVLLLLARVLLGWIFIRSGYGKVTDLSPFIASLGRDGLPFPQVIGTIAAGVEFFGGIALILGIQVRLAALLLVAFVVIATLLRHRYWEFADAAAFRAQSSNFYKNVAMTGGLLAVFVTGAGCCSVASLWTRSSDRPVSAT